MKKILLCLLIIFIITDGVLIWKYVLSNIIKYPVNQKVAEKIKKAGLTPLYQIKKDDPECRSIVFEGRIKQVNIPNSIVTSIKLITTSNDYYITIKKINSGKSITFRFVPNETLIYLDDLSFSKDESNDLDLNTYRKLSSSQVQNLLNQKTLLIVNDVIEVGYPLNEKLHELEKDVNGFLRAGYIIIRRCQKI